MPTRGLSGGDHGRRVGAVAAWFCCGGVIQFAGQVNAIPAALENQEWRIFNLAPTAKVWALLELEFHIETSCDSRVLGAPISSGDVLFSTLGWHSKLFAFDGLSVPSMESTWWPRCGSGLGRDGCQAEEAWIGLNFDEVTHDIRCIRIYQAPFEGHKASQVALERWTGAAWQRVRVFREALGQYFVNLPTEPLAQWRILPLEAQSAGWSVAELNLSRDMHCGSSLAGMPGSYGFVGNGTASSDLGNSPGFAVDNDEVTAWQAPCLGGGCALWEPWLEISIRQSGPVRCLRLLQPEASGARGVLLLAWTGEQYENASTFVELTPGAWDHLIRWEDSAQMAGTLWRLLPNGTAVSEWVVAELELHKHANCSGPLEVVFAMSSGAVEGSWFGAIADGEPSPNWRAVAPTAAELTGALWAERYAGSTAKGHVLGFPWAGVAVRAASEVWCVRLLQGGGLQRAMPELVLQRWSGAAWEDYREDVAGYGELSRWYSGLAPDRTSSVDPGWLHLPSADRIQWRLAQLDVLWEHWAVKELRLFQTIDCQAEISGTPIPMAPKEDPLEPRHPSSWAFDRELSTEWWSTCEWCEAREAWLGLLLAAPRSVRCAQLFQSGRSPVWSQAVAIEKWNGHRWAGVAEIRFLSRGVWDHLHAYGHSPLWDDGVSDLPYWSTQPNRLWRVTNADALLQRWAVASLGFYRDLDCRELIADALPMASGHVIDFEEDGAFDGNTAVEWLSSCTGCVARQAWVGLHMPAAQWPRCVQLFQSVRPLASSRRVAVQRFDGHAWAEVALLDGLGMGTWRTQQLMQPGTQGDRRVRWRLAVRGLATTASTPSGWRVTSIRFFGAGGCKDRLHGFHIASGHISGHEVFAAFDEDLDTYWESGSRGTTSGQAWLGLSVAAGDPMTRCVQLRQQRATAWGASAVAVEAFVGGGSWLEVATFEPLSFGTWDHFHLSMLPQLSAARPAEAVPVGAMWRVANGAWVQRSWVIVRLGFFAAMRNAACAEQLIGVPIASGHAGGFPATGVELNGSEWHSPCFECSPGMAWIGILLPAAAEVRCVLLEQSGLERDSTESVTLERWDGNSWAASRRFGGLSGGAAQQLSGEWEWPAALQRFRVANTAIVGGRWRVLELHFYAAVDCTMAANGSPISSGFAGAAAAPLAFDGDLATAWEASGVTPIPARSAWLGVHLAKPQDVKCAVLRQGDGHGQWAPKVALEVWNGTAWQHLVDISILGIGAWFAMHAFVSPLSPLWVNFQDQNSAPPEGYEADSGKPFGIRPSGWRYGWSCNLQGLNRQRSSNLLLDTLVELRGCPNAAWELEVPVSRYYTRITYSNPGVGGSTSGCRLEGLRADAGSYGPEGMSLAEMAVDVRDGRLTFNATDGACSAISAIEVSCLPGPGSAWRAANGARVHERWRVQELELHEAVDCSVDANAQPRTGSLASGYLDGQPPKLALDGDVATGWASACHGCPPGAAWIGLSFPVMQKVRCLRLHQSLDTGSEAGIIVLDQWDGTAWSSEQTFVNTPGGLWGEYNERWVRPPNKHRWRLVPEVPLAGPLRVAEAGFFEDTGCSMPLQGFAIANEPDPSSPVYHAFDSDFSTEWVSSCGPCLAGEAWLGLHSDTVLTVLCVMVTLGRGTGRRLLEGAPGQEASSGTLPLRLESWNGSGWAPTEAVLPGRPGARVRAQRLVEAQELEPGAAWRLVQIASTSSPWRIQEVQFHRQSSCSGLLSGRPLASSEQPLHPANMAFDGNQAYLSAWVAGCEDSGCAAEAEWVGILFEQTQAPQCVRLYQSSPTLTGDPAAKVIRLERWGGTGWETVRTFGTEESVVSGRWATLTVLSTSAKYQTKAKEWRLVSDRAIAKHWAVAEVAFFDNVECQEPLQGTPVASGDVSGHFVTAAFDGLVDSYWWSQGGAAAREAWIGLASGRGYGVRCVQLLQQEDPAYMTTEAQLQLRVEADWLHIQSFAHIAFGQRQNLHVFPALASKPPGAMWRVVNGDWVARGWVLVEFELYADAACSKIEVGQPISSGYSTGQQPALAFDLQLASRWRSPCRSCARGRAWLGQSFHRLGVPAGQSSARVVTIQCVVLMQGDGLDASSTGTVLLERWNGETFRRVGRFWNVPRGEFVQLHLSSSLMVNDTVVVDFERKQQVLAASTVPNELPGWRASLARTQDRVEVFVAMFVLAWPLELTISRQHTESFTASFAAALRTTAAARLKQPRSHVFVDDVSMNLPLLLVGERASRGAISAKLVVHVAASGDAQAVLSMVKGMMEDSYRQEAVLLADSLKVELRRESRFSPVLANMVAQVEPSMELRLSEAEFFSAVPPTAPTTPPPAPLPAPPPPADRTWMYALVLGLLLLLMLVAVAWRHHRWRRLQLQSAIEVWEANHPGIPFPKKKPANGWLCRCPWWRRRQHSIFEGDSQAVGRSSQWRRSVVMQEGAALPAMREPSIRKSVTFH